MQKAVHSVDDRDRCYESRKEEDDNSRAMGIALMQQSEDSLNSQKSAKKDWLQQLASEILTWTYTFHSQQGLQNTLITSM